MERSVKNHNMRVVQGQQVSTNPSMVLFDNISYIRENSGLGVAKLASILGVNPKELEDFMIINNIPTA